MYSSMSVPSSFMSMLCNCCAQQQVDLWCISRLKLKPQCLPCQTQSRVNELCYCVHQIIFDWQNHFILHVSQHQLCHLYTTDNSRKCSTFYNIFNDIPKVLPPRNSSHLESPNIIVYDSF
jgi:hypothetical protein